MVHSKLCSASRQQPTLRYACSCVYAIMAGLASFFDWRDRAQLLGEAVHRWIWVLLGVVCVMAPATMALFVNGWCLIAVQVRRHATLCRVCSTILFPRYNGGHCRADGVMVDGKHSVYRAAINTLHNQHARCQWAPCAVSGVCTHLDSSRLRCTRTLKTFVCDCAEGHTCHRQHGAGSAGDAASLAAHLPAVR